MTNFIQCPRCNQIVPAFGHDCHAGRYQMIATGDSHPAPREPDPTALRLARALDLLRDCADRLDSDSDDDPLYMVVGLFLAEPPTAAEAEHAALLRVAEAADAFNRPPWVFNDEWRTTPSVQALYKALADLRQARNGGSDGQG